MEEKTALQAIEDIRNAAAKAVAHVGAANCRERREEAERWIEDAYVKAVLSVTPPVAPATDAERRAKEVKPDYSKATTPKGRAVTFWNCDDAPTEECPDACCWVKTISHTGFIRSYNNSIEYSREDLRGLVPNQWPWPDNTLAIIDAWIDGIEAKAEAEKPYKVWQRFTDRYRICNWWFNGDSVSVAPVQLDGTLGTSSGSGSFPTETDFAAAIRRGESKPVKKPVTPWTFETIPELTMRVRTIRSGNPKVACARPNCVVGYDDRGIAFNVSYPQFAERYVRMDGSPCGV